MVVHCTLFFALRFVAGYKYVLMNYCALTHTHTHPIFHTGVLFGAIDRLFTNDDNYKPGKISSSYIVAMRDKIIYLKKK